MSEKLVYRWKTKPFNHQVRAVKKLLSTGWGGALLMEPRTGKTKTAIDYTSILHQAGHVEKVLVVGPASVLDVWKGEIAAHCPFDAHVYIWDKEERKLNVPLPFTEGQLTFVVVNYEAFSTAGAVVRRDDEGRVVKRSSRRGGRYTARRRIESWEPDLIILDESHRIKSPSAAKSRTLHKLGPVASYRVILTGTGVTKKKRIFDVWSQWMFLNPDRFADYTFAEFKSRVGRWVKKPNPHKPKLTYDFWAGNRPSEVEWVRNEIHKDSFAVTRAECFDLPARLPPQIIHVELEESASVYDAMAEDMVAKIKTGEVTEASIRLVQSLRLGQITSGFTKTIATPEHPRARLVRIGREKLRVLEELLSDLFEADQKVVVAARWRADISAAVRICEQLKVPVFQLHGGIPQRERHPKHIIPFRNAQGAACFVAQPSAGSLGIDLSTASTMIWVSLTNSWVDFTQMEDRIALSNVGCSFIYLLARGTVDEVMYESLQEDGDIGRYLMKAPERLLRSSS